MMNHVVSFRSMSYGKSRDESYGRLPFDVVDAFVADVPGCGVCWGWQEVLGWIMDLQKKFKAEGKPVNKETITAFAWDTLKAGKVR
jgi:hypothetical protein